MPTFTLELLQIFCISLLIIFAMRRVAVQINLVDKPNERKFHSGAIPLVGGISICLSLMFFLIQNPNALPYSYPFSFSVFVLVVVGALDDRYDVSFKLRFAIQTFISLYMMHVTGINLHSIGDILGFGSLDLGWLGYVVTVFAVVGAINAFNMVDGIDGLLGGLSIVTFSAIGLLLLDDGQPIYAYTCLVVVVTMLPYIMFNLGFFGRKHKIFMGDAGSMVIGFMVVWFLLCSSQTKGETLIRPVTALWLIAVPLMDMASIMIRRIRRGDSPFKPDREHLHHIFQRLGFSSTQTLFLICLLAAAFAAVGIFTERAGVPEYVMFYAFLGTFMVYAYALSHIWKITKTLRKWFGISGKQGLDSKEDDNSVAHL